MAHLDEVAGALPSRTLTVSPAAASQRSFTSSLRSGRTPDPNHGVRQAGLVRATVSRSRARLRPVVVLEREAMALGAGQVHCQPLHPAVGLQRLRGVDEDAREEVEVVSAKAMGRWLR